MFREGRILTLLPFGNGNGEAMSTSPWEEALGKGDEDVATPAWWGTGNGEAMASSPWEGALGEGDGDVATPFHAGAGSGG